MTTPVSDGLARKIAEAESFNARPESEWCFTLAEIRDFHATIERLQAERAERDAALRWVYENGGSMTDMTELRDIIAAELRACHNAASDERPPTYAEMADAVVRVPVIAGLVGKK